MSSSVKKKESLGNSSSRKSSKEEEKKSLPDIKPVCVGVAPVRNGFGQLSSGSKVIYKGMWKDGKFEGKGKLLWNGYTYEGDFQKGMF